ncbi:putative intramolecular chaperone auto-processing domain-containing protein [Plasmopara halstedii]
MWADGGSTMYSVAQEWRDNASTPARIQLQIANNGAGALFGTATNHPFGIMVENSSALYINASKYVGIGTTNPFVPLHVSTAISYTFGAGGTTVHRLRTDGGTTESALCPISYNVSALFGGYIGCSALAMTSDQRLKRNTQSCPIYRVKRFYDSCEGKLYDWIESENKPGQEIDLIAQDLVSAQLADLISIYYRDHIEGGEDPSLKPAKQQLNVDYSRISAYNMKMINTS